MKKTATKLLSPIVPLVGLALLWATVTACFPGTEGDTSVPQEPAAGSVQDSAPDQVETAERDAPSPEVTTAAPAPPPATAWATPTVAAAPELAESRQAPGEPASAAPAEVPGVTPELPAAEAAPAVTASPEFGNLESLEDSALGYLKELAEGLGPRTSSTDLEKAAAEYLLELFEDLGYSPELQEFSVSDFHATLNVTTPALGELDVNTLNGTVNGEATAQLVFVGLGKPEDFPEEGLEGKIAFMERGEVTFGNKVAQAARAGAVAAVIFNNGQGNFRGSLGGRSDIPAISLSRADGLRLLELLNQGMAVSATVSVAQEERPSRNVIAELPGKGEGVVVVGAHFDTVPHSMGASDNASGMGVVLAIAEEVAEESFPFTLRFIAFGSEETGLHGSEYYVDSMSREQLDEIYLMVNLDSVGSGSHLRLAGDRWAASHVKETADREGISLALSRRSSQGGSDHANFRDAWVPVLFFLSDDLSRINSPADTMEHINPGLLGDATALVLDLLENVDQLSGYGQ